MYILNAISLNMIPSAEGYQIHVSPPLSLEEVKALLQKEDGYAASGFANRGVRSGVGHADTAAVFASQLGRPVVAARINVNLLANEACGGALVGQYIGPRLPEGAIALPEGARIEWRHVTITSE